MSSVLRANVSMPESVKRDAMSLAAKQGKFTFSAIMREALELWITVQEIQPHIEDFVIRQDRLFAAKTTPAHTWATHASAITPALREILAAIGEPQDD